MSWTCNGLPGGADGTTSASFAAISWLQKQIAKIVCNGFKMEIESLITKDISYVSQEYVPQWLKDKD